MAKTIVGIVTSNKTDKTIVVTVHTRKTHPLYKKQYTVTSKFMAHDEQNEAQPGDKVSIVETRPISARKRFKLAEILEKPELREDSLAIAKSDDSGNATMHVAKPAKAKAEEAEAEASEEQA
jgi:small subunit ribosomal protein S17